MYDPHTPTRDFGDLCKTVRGQYPSYGYTFLYNTVGAHMNAFRFEPKECIMHLIMISHLVSDTERTPNINSTNHTSKYM